MRYVSASRSGEGPLVAMSQDLPKMVVTRDAAMPLEYGIKGDELIRLLRKGMEKFIRAMELQGLTLIPLPQGNPLVVAHTDGRPFGTYSITHDLARTDQPDAETDWKTGGSGTPTYKTPRNLDDSRGMVDYRFTGVFWAPQVSMEIITTREARLAKERAARNPMQFAS